MGTITHIRDAVPSRGSYSRRAYSRRGGFVPGIPVVHLIGFSPEGLKRFLEHLKTVNPPFKHTHFFFSSHGLKVNPWKPGPEERLGLDISQKDKTKTDLFSDYMKPILDYSAETQKQSFIEIDSCFSGQAQSDWGIEALIKLEEGNIQKSELGLMTNVSPHRTATAADFSSFEKQFADLITQADCYDPNEDGTVSAKEIYRSAQKYVGRVDGQAVTVNPFMEVQVIETGKLRAKLAHQKLSENPFYKKAVDTIRKCSRVCENCVVHASKQTGDPSHSVPER
jgi:hypothetical protein